MPVNETGSPIIHKGLGNTIIRPGEFYPGREVGPDGEYISNQPKEAPAKGASPPSRTHRNRSK